MPHPRAGARSLRARPRPVRGAGLLEFRLTLHSAKHLKSSFTYIVSFDIQNILELKMTFISPLLLVNTMMLMEVVA